MLLKAKMNNIWENFANAKALYKSEKLQIWLLLFETPFYGIENQLLQWQMSGNTWMITLKVYFFSLPSITNKYLIYIWNMATLKAINPSTQHAAKQSVS